jgi:hypothetical protein
VSVRILDMTDKKQVRPEHRVHWWSSSKDVWLLFSLLWANLLVFILVKDADPVVLILTVILASVTFYHAQGHHSITNRRERVLFWLVAGSVLLLFNYASWK